MKLIDKDALVAEIENIRKHYIERDDFDNGWNFALDKVLSFIDSLEVKEANNVWHEVDNVNLPQSDKNKIYCVLSKTKYLLARVMNNPKDEELLQWKCTEFPFHRYDMCEGDKYMQII